MPTLMPPPMPRPMESAAPAWLVDAPRFELRALIRLLERQVPAQDAAGSAEHREPGQSTEPVHGDVPAHAAVSAPPRQQLGMAGSPAYEAIRLRPALSLAFPSSDIEHVDAITVSDETGANRPMWRVTTTLPGLYGHASPLPTAYTELLLDQRAEGQANARALLDVIHHRVLSLLVRALVACRGESGAALRAAAALSGGDPSPRAGGTATLGACRAGGLAASTTATSRAIYAAALARVPRSAAGLEAALRFAFDLPIVVEACHPRWAAIPPAARCRLGQHGRLGRDAAAGTRMLTRTTCVRIRVGPLGPDRLNDFLPGGRARAVLCDLAADFNPARFDLCLDVLAAPSALPPARLDATSRLATTARLAGKDPGHTIRTVGG